MMLDRYLNEILSGLIEPGKVVPVDIREAARMFYEDTKNETWDWRKDFPTLVSPWPLAWYEWQSPVQYQSDGVMKSVQLPTLNFGALVGCFRLDPNRPTPPLSRMFQGLIEKAPNTKSPSIPAHWLLQVLFFAETPNRTLLHYGQMISYLDDAGLPDLDSRVIISSSPSGNAIKGLMLPLAFAISLLHCKNVTVVDKPIPEKVQRARIRRGKQPKIVYKTLEIEPMRQILHTEGQVERVGLQRALHICRGHFKDYREKGLFGLESHKGIYWWDMHVRGTPEAGAVVKDYRVLRPRNGDKPSATDG